MYVSATLNSCRGRKKKIESSETIKEKCNLGANMEYNELSNNLESNVLGHKYEF